LDAPSYEDQFTGILDEGRLLTISII